MRDKRLRNAADISGLHSHHQLVVYNDVRVSVEDLERFVTYERYGLLSLERIDSPNTGLDAGISSSEPMDPAGDLSANTFVWRVAQLVQPTSRRKLNSVQLRTRQLRSHP